MLSLQTNTATAATKGARLRETKLGVLGRDRSIPHVGRKFYHMVMGIGCFALYAFALDRTGAIVALCTIGGTFVILDVLRLKSPPVNELALKFFGNLMRREELKRLSANSFYVLGMLVITILFPKPVVLLSVLYLAIGDPVAAVVGTVFGRRKLIGAKSLEGTAANFAATAAVTLIVSLSYFHDSPDRALLLALVGGASSALAELAPLPVNDNFSIPVLSAMLLSIASALLPIF